jgi:hypothetical protein
MNATKLAVAGFFTFTLMFAANAQIASAAPYHGPVGHYAYHGAYWGHRPIYSVAPVYSYAPVATCVADATVVPVAPVVTTAVPTYSTGVYFGGHRFVHRFRHWR